MRRTPRRPDPITPAQYRAIQEAYDFMNRRLFDGTLPDVLVTLQRKARSRGYFAAERFAGRRDASKVHEMALNPDAFEGRTDREIVSTQVHEMVHLWQEEYGTPPRRAYHDREWAAKMKAIGLQPSTTGEPGGKETGQNMTHYIIKGGRFDKAFDELAAKGFALQWQSSPFDTAGRAKARASKTKFTCPDCQQNAWAKPDAILICGVCYDEDSDEVSLMVAQETEPNAEAAA
jgi:SprT-like family